MEFSKLGITSDDQLRILASKMGLPKIQYIGFAEDLRLLPEGLSIINLGGNQGGTHWTMLWVQGPDDPRALSVSNEPRQIVYFDSYGVGPEDQIILLANGRGVSFNKKQVQRYEEEHCGIWALLAAKAIIEAKKNNINAKQAIDTFVSGFSSV